MACLFFYEIGHNQISQDTIAVFDSLTVDDDQDLDSVIFVLSDRWGERVGLTDHLTDSSGLYWRYQPAYWDGGVHSHLGNTGSATLATYWQPDDRVAFRHGFEQFDLFNLRAEDHLYLETDRAYTDISYNQAPQQTKSQTNILFGRSISRQSGVSLHYDRINDDGEYANQKFRHTGISAGVYHFINQHRSVHFAFTSNNVLSEEHGGIQEDSLLNLPQFANRISVPINLASALAEYRDRAGLLTLRWGLGSTAMPHLYLLADVQYKRTNYKYVDAVFNEGYYGPYAVDDRGQRAAMNLRRWSGSAGLEWRYGQHSGAVEGVLSSRMYYANNDYEQGLASRSIVDVIWKNRWVQTTGELKLQADLDVQLGDQAGDYLGQVRAMYGPHPSWVVYAAYRDQRQTPTGIDRRFVTLGQTIYDRAEQASTYRSLTAGISSTPWKVKLEIGAHLMTDHVYFDSNLLPDQIEDDVLLLQAQAAWNYQIGILYMDHHIYLQQSDDDRLPRPSLTSSHYVGLRWRAFKRRLHLDTGLDARILPSDGWGYFPMTGRFYPSAGEIDTDYTVDGVFAFQVDRFRVFFKWENMHLTWSDTPRFIIDDYPIFDGRLRLGFRWLLRG